MTDETRMSGREMPTRRGVLVGIGAAVTASAAAATALAIRPAIAKGRFDPQGDATFDHAAFDLLLKRAVKPDAAGYNRVDYKRIAASHRDLKAYVASLEAAKPTALSRPEAHAFWINLYNAKTLDVVLDHYPVASIKAIALGGGGLFGSGPWSRKIMSVDGVELSLDDVEHEIVRPVFADPLSHYALNCASYSCPNLATRAFTGRNLRALMAENAVAYVNHPRGVDARDGRIVASKIYSWYSADFGGKARLKPHWKRFASPQLSARIDASEIAGYDYDWSLNDV